VPIIFAHYQPEATTFPEGGKISTHIDIVIQIRNLGYKGIILYKEHPNCWTYYSEITGFSKTGIYRSRSYYLQLKELGCLFISDTFDIKSIDRSLYLPVTITGTIALERSLLGYFTCFTGNPWYAGIPGAFNLNEVTSINELLSKISLERKFNKTDATNWIMNILSFKTLNNYVGIGTGKISKDKLNKDAFLAELTSLISFLQLN
jgi:hypothetical protein